MSVVFSYMETPFSLNPVFYFGGLPDFLRQLDKALRELNIFLDARPCHTTALRCLTSFFTKLNAGKALADAKAVVVPCAVEVNVALVQSDELVRLSSIAGNICGFDLTALNALRHRTCAVRLSEILHVVLTQPAAAVRLRLDTPELLALSGESEVLLRAEKTGVAHAIVVWHTFKLDTVHSVSTGPEESGDTAARQFAHFLWPPELGELDWATHDAAQAQRKGMASEAASTDASAASHGSVRRNWPCTRE